MKKEGNKLQVNGGRRRARKRILIVSNDGCARGYMAYATVKRRLANNRRAGAPEVRVSGIFALSSAKADPFAEKVLKRKGWAANGFRVQPLDEALLGCSDLLIALSQEDWNYLRNTYRNFPREAMILRVPVIVEKSVAAYEKALDLIQERLDEGLKGLKLA